MARTATAQTAPPPTDTTTPPIAAAPADVGIVWTCPYCGSDDLRVLYDERRACRVATLNDTGDPADAAPLRRLQQPRHHATQGGRNP